VNISFDFEANETWYVALVDLPWQHTFTDDSDIVSVSIILFITTPQFYST
jgi:hypothetical protein